MRRAALFVTLLGGLALAGPWLAPQDPLESRDEIVLRLLPPGAGVPAAHLRSGGWLPLAPPVRTTAGELVYQRGSRRRSVPLEQLRTTAGGEPEISTLRCWLGTDRLGRDLLSRLLAGARTSLLIGLGAVLLAGLLGGTVALAALLGGRRADALLGQLGDSLLAVPRIIVVMVLAAIWRPPPLGVALLLGATGWPGIARLLRAEGRSLAATDLVAAARATGAGRLRVGLRHLLPQLAPTLLVAMGLRLGPFVLLEASLSFLGFGVAPPAPSWGNILADGRDVLLEAWWLTVLPGAALAFAVLLANAAADRLRDALSPIPR